MPDAPIAHSNWPRLVPDDRQPWETLDSADLSAPPRRYVRDRVRTQAGAEVEYVYRPRGPRAAFVFPVTATGQAVLIRQYRYPLRATVTEVVAGGMEDGETVLACAVRELREEVGGVAAEWVPLPGFYAQPSVSGAAFYPLLALGVTLDVAQPEADELIETRLVPLAEAYRQLEAGEILNGPSSLVMFHARRVLEARGLLSTGGP